MICRRTYLQNFFKYCVQGYIEELMSIPVLRAKGGHTKSWFPFLVYSIFLYLPKTFTQYCTHTVYNIVKCSAAPYQWYNNFFYYLSLIFVSLLIWAYAPIPEVIYSLNTAKLVKCYIQYRKMYLFLLLLNIWWWAHHIIKVIMCQSTCMCACWSINKIFPSRKPKPPIPILMMLDRVFRAVFPPK